MERTIPAEMLDEYIEVSWNNGDGEQSFRGIMVFSGEHMVRLKYYRRNHETKKIRQYFLTIYADQITSWKKVKVTDGR